MRRTPRHYLFWLVAVLLLWQQMALAANVCAMSVPSMAAAATSVSALRPACMSAMPGHADKLMCAQHCAQGTAVQSDARSPNVPGSLLPPLAPAAPVVVMSPSAEASFASTDRVHVFRPPLRLLFCSQLI